MCCSTFRSDYDVEAVLFLRTKLTRFLSLLTVSEEPTTKLFSLHSPSLRPPNPPNWTASRPPHSCLQSFASRPSQNSSRYPRLFFVSTFSFYLPFVVIMTTGVVILYQSKESSLPFHRKVSREISERESASFARSNPERTNRPVLNCEANLNWNASQ